MKLRAIVLAGALVLSAAACSGKDQPPHEESKKDGSSAVAVINPLTGLQVAGEPNNPVFVVKVDNTAASAPQTAIDKADLVVEELVEGGETRLAALYYTKLPSSVGHVRSMRATDIGIAAPVNGQIVASGGAGVTIRRIREAGLAIHSEDDRSPGFSRGPGYAPYNVLVNLKQVNAVVEQQAPERPYFQWGPVATGAATGKLVKSVTVRFSGLHATSFKRSGGTWKRTNGTSEKEFAADNLVVLWADEKNAGYNDPAGNPVPETVFDGHGKAVIFVGGKQIKANWRKATKASTIVLTDKAGAEIKLPQGRTWIELLSKAQAGELTVN